MINAIEPCVLGVKSIDRREVGAAGFMETYGVTIGNRSIRGSNVGAWDGLGGIDWKYRLFGPVVMNIEATVTVSNRAALLASNRGLLVGDVIDEGVLRSSLDKMVSGIGRVSPRDLRERLLEVLSSVTIA